MSRTIVASRWLSTTYETTPPYGPLAHREEQGTFNPKVPRSRLGRPTNYLVTWLEVPFASLKLASDLANRAGPHLGSGLANRRANSSPPSFRAGGMISTKEQFLHGLRGPLPRTRKEVHIYVFGDVNGGVSKLV
jgi:hypothetical protein